MSDSLGFTHREMHKNEFHCYNKVYRFVKIFLRPCFDEKNKNKKISFTLICSHIFDDWSTLSNYVQCVPQGQIQITSSYLRKSRLTSLGSFESTSSVWVLFLFLLASASFVLACTTCSIHVKYHFYAKFLSVITHRNYLNQRNDIIPNHG